MKRAGVKSSRVRWVGYDLDDHVLEIGFVTGGVYHYLDVPPEVVLAMLESDSIGRYLNREIRGRYHSRPVRRAS
jgi:hypothetical protein